MSPKREGGVVGRWLAEHPLVASKDFRGLFVGDVLVNVGERFFSLTFVWWLLAGPHADKSRLGLLLILESLPVLAVGVLAGPLVDRWNKKRSMLISTLIQSAVAGGVAVLVAADALSFPRLCVAAALLASLIPVFEGAAAAGVSQSVTEEQLPAAAALQSMSVEFSNVISAALAAIVLSAFGFVVAAAVTAALYLGAALFLSQLRDDAFTGKADTDSYIGDLKLGLAYIVHRPPLASFVGIYLGAVFLITPLVVLFPMLVQAVLGGVVGWVAVLETAFSAGAIATTVVLSLRMSGRWLYRRLIFSLAFFAVLMVVLARIRNPIAMIPNVALMGACMAMLMALSNVLFQQTVPDRLKGRFFGVLDTLIAAITPLAFGALGLAYGSAGVSGVLVATGGGLALLGVAVFFSPRLEYRRVRNITAEWLAARQQ